MSSLDFDVAHLLSGLMVLVCFLMLYQDRLYSLLNTFALHALVLAATGAKGMPLVVEISVAFSILIAFIVIGIFLFRIRERFDTVDVGALDAFRGDRR